MTAGVIIESPWLTRLEAAEYLRLCPDTIDSLTAAGTLRAHRIPRGNGMTSRIVRYRRSELDAALIPDDPNQAAEAA